MKTKIAAAVALACLSSFAFAQAKQGDAGWYVGGHLGRSSTDFSGGDFNPIVGIPVSVTKDEQDTAWKLLLGYNFDQNWALEGFYTNLGEPQIKYNSAAGSGEFRINNDAWGLAVKGTIPVHQQWDLYGRLGWTYNRSDMSASFTVPAFFGSSSWSAHENRSDVMFGVGMEWKPQKNWGIRLEYENYGEFGNSRANATDYTHTGKTESDMWSLGVVVRF